RGAGRLVLVVEGQAQVQGRTPVGPQVAADAADQAAAGAQAGSGGAVVVGVNAFHLDKLVAAELVTQLHFRPQVPALVLLPAAPRHAGVVGRRQRARRFKRRRLLRRSRFGGQGRGFRRGGNRRRQRRRRRGGSRR